MPSNLQPFLDARQLSVADAAGAVDAITAGRLPDPPSEADLLTWLATEYSLRFTDLADENVDTRVLAGFPVRALLAYELLPLRRVGDRVEVATWRLFDARGIDLLRSLTNEELTPVLAPRERLLARLKEHLGVGADTLDSIERDSALRIVADLTQEDVNLDDVAQDASIIRFVNQILTDAIGQRATDVHLEPFEDELQIRYRVDGVLQDVPVPAQLKRYQPAIVSRLKILSSLDIAEKRLPQDGRIKLRLKQAEVDVRVSVIPMVHGEAVVLRLLHQATALAGLAALQISGREESLLRRVLGLPHGIVLVTGPTGSGKTTTLYAALQEINQVVRKIITIEDPVEYRMKGINQIQVNSKIDLSFARGLRAVLRHDPDVILIGEIRDSETARIAVQASLTGHLVFSTLHTNDAPSALPRLIDMGVEPYLVASSVDTVVAQRLIRILCPHCAAPDDSSAARTQRRDPAVGAQADLRRAVGCEHCRHTGYVGRRAVFEVMRVGEDVRRLILDHRSAGDIRGMARSQGMRTLREDGLRLVAAGITSLDELYRVTADADDSDLDTLGAPAPMADTLPER